MQLVGSASGISSAASLPEHQAGDWIFCWSFRDGNTGAPTLPADWQSHSTQAGSSCGARLAYRIATGPGTPPGTFTNATSAVYWIIRPDPGCTLSIGVSASASGTTTAFNYPALTGMSATARKRAMGMSGHRSTNTNLESPPAPLVLIANVADATDEATVAWTGEVSSFATASMTLTGTASGWLSRTVELRESGPPTVTTLPSISGGTQVGSTLTLTDGTYGENGGGTVSLARQWVRGSTDIVGQTGSTYTTTTDDVGQSITARVTASNASGPTPATSNAIGPIVAPSGGGGGGLWTPADLAVPPYAWWDVRDTATLTIVDGRVTMIADKSGNGRHLIGRRAAPEYLATGMPTAMPSARIGPNVYPDGTYGGYSTDIGADFGLDGGNFSAFAAFHQPYLADQGWYQTMGLQLANYANMVPWEYRGDVSRDTIHVMYWPQGAAAVRGFAQYDGWNAIGWSGGHGTEYVLADYYTDSVSFNSLISNGSAMLHHLNGILRESVDIEAPIAITCVGYGEQVRHQYQPGVLGGTDVGEGVILAYQASLDERQRLEGYFAWGWGSENRLPADHPYRNAPPASEAGPGPMSGSLNVTEQPDTLAATGRVRLNAGATLVESNDALTSTGRVRPRGQLSVTDQPDTVVATGCVRIRSTASIQEAGDYLSSTAELAVRGTLSGVEEGDTLSSAAGLLVKAVATAQLGESDDTLVATARAALTGSAALMDHGDVLVAQARAAARGSASFTEAGDVVSATARLRTSASAMLAESDDNVHSTGAVRISAVVSIVEPEDDLSAVGRLALRSATDVAEDADWIASQGRSRVSASAVLIEQGDTLAASSTSVVLGFASIIEGDDTLAADGRVPIEATLAATERGDVVAAIAAARARASAALADGPDTVSSSGRVGLTAEALVVEGGDELLASASTPVRAFFLGVEGGDTLTAGISAVNRGSAWVLEDGDVLVAAGTQRVDRRTINLVGRIPAPAQIEVRMKSQVVAVSARITRTSDIEAELRR